MLLDTASLYYRAYFGVPDTVRAPDGTPVNAVRGLLDFIARLVQDHRPDSLVACMDADWRPQWRVDLIPSYKAHRVAQETDQGPDEEDTPDTLAPQVPMIEQVLDALGIARVGVEGYEADDVIGTLAGRATGPVDIVTGDRDLYQLVDDARGIRVLYPLKGVGNLQLTDEALLREKYGVTGQGYVDLALLRGDPSDGLPGVPGIGEKTAAKLLDAFGDLAGIMAAVDDPASRLTPRSAGSWTRRALMSRWRRRWCGWLRTYRCRRSTRPCPPSRATPPPWNSRAPCGAWADRFSACSPLSRAEVLT